MAAAQETYYADVTISIDDTGNAIIRGITNHETLKERSAQELTSKKGPYWLFNLSINETFSDFVYEIRLPEGSVVNFVKSTTPVRIGSDKGTFVKAIGKNEKLQIAIQYGIEKKGNGPDVFYIIAGLLITGTAAFFIFRKKKPSIHAIKPWYNKDMLADRQKEIVSILEKETGPMTQKQLEDRMNIPKSSLSRNIDSLVQKGILAKEEKGMTNALQLNQKKPQP